MNSAAELARVRETLGMVSAGGVTEQLQAIGSRSVTGLESDAPCDLGLAVWPFPLALEPLAALGYAPLPGYLGAPEQRFFNRQANVQLFVAEAGSPRFMHYLLVRDFLQDSAAARRRFRAFKADPGPLDKDGFFATLLPEAKTWWITQRGFAPVTATALELRDLRVPWFFSSGWAIDIFLNRVTRVHHDIDIIVSRADINALRAYLGARGWQLVLPLEGKLEPWPPESPLEPDIQIHAHRGGVVLDVQLTKMDTTTWHYRRDPRLTCPAAQAFFYTDAGLPYLAPELALLFKSQNTSRERRERPQDQHDFEVALPQLSPAQRAWLLKALTLTDPRHGWLEALAAT